MRWTDDVRGSDWLIAAVVVAVLAAGLLGMLALLDRPAPPPAPSRSPGPSVKVRAVALAGPAVLASGTPRPGAAAKRSSPDRRSTSRRSKASRIAKARASRSGQALPGLEGEPSPTAPEPPILDAEPTGLPSLADELEVADDEAAGGGGDAYQAALIDAYRDRLERWLSSRFAVRGSGVGEAELTRLRARARVEIAEDRTVLAFELEPSGNPAFDEAARRTLEAIRGELVPAPPQDYPFAIARTLSVTFVCRASQCD